MIEFVVPEFIEGPKEIFFIELSESFKNIPFVSSSLEGKYGLSITSTVITTWCIIIFLTIIFKLGTRKLQYVPEGLQFLLESIYNFIEGIIDQILGKWKKKYIVFIITLFIFILISNIISFFPIPFISYSENIWHLDYAFKAPTSDFNTTLALALLTTVTFIGTNIRYNGILGYFKGFFSPAKIVFPLNVIGEMSKPLSLSIRLFGNMFAGSVIIGLLYSKFPYFVPGFLQLYFDLILGFMQAYVFVMLALVYIQGALGDNEFIE